MKLIVAVLVFGALGYWTWAAQQESPVTGEITSLASDPDGDALTFSKVTGPAWLSVAADGTLAGTPGRDDAGTTNSWVVKVTDSCDAFTTATLLIFVRHVNHPPQWPSGNTIDLPGAVEDQTYHGSIRGFATDSDIR